MDEASCVGIFAGCPGNGGCTIRAVLKMGYTGR